MDLHAKIPGQTPLDDTSGLRIKGIKTRRQLNDVEFQNLTLAMDKYLARKPTRRMAPFSREWMLRLHGECFGRVWKWAGNIRTTDLNVGAAPQQIALALEDLAGYLAYWRESQHMTLVEQSVLLHYRSVHIHPFVNGNGRWARLLTNIWLKQCGGIVLDWPEEAIADTTSVIREEYISALKQADKGNLTPLTELHQRYSGEVET